MSVSPSVSNAAASINTAIDAVPGRLQDASRVALAPIAMAVTTALAALDSQVSTTEASIDQATFGGVGSLTPAPVLAARLLAQFGLVSDLSTLKIARGYIARVGVNIANAPG